VTTDQKLRAIRDVIQNDVGKRGLRTDAEENPITATLYDFAEACKSFAQLKKASVGIVTGFVIPTVDPPKAETDGPLGALFLARVFTALGMRAYLITDRHCAPALKAGVESTGIGSTASVVTMPLTMAPEDVGMFRQSVGPLTHLISVERVGPSHTPSSVGSQLEGTSLTVEWFRKEVPEEAHDRCHTMRGRDITDLTAPLHLLFEADDPKLAEVTIGVGDGGNEIGMGKVAWQTIRKNIPEGHKVACRVPTDYLIVAGVSNWGAYALGAGVALVRNARLDAALFEPAKEQALLQQLVEAGPLVDGVTGASATTVDGLTWEQYAEPVQRIGEIARG
jgi:hypothetical protein